MGAESTGPTTRREFVPFAEFGSEADFVASVTAGRQA